MDRDRSGRGCWRIDALRLVIKQSQDCRFWLYHCAMAVLPIELDRARRTPLAAQIYSGDPRRPSRTDGSPRARGCPPGRIWPLNSASPAAPCAWLTSVSIAEQFAIGLGPAGTRVAERQSRSSIPDWSPEAPLLPELFYEFGTAPLAFQMGVPSQDAFPFKLWSRILTRETRRAAAAPVDVSGSAWRSGAAKGGRGLLGTGPRHSVQSLSGARNERIRRCARSGDPRASA